MAETHTALRELSFPLPNSPNTKIHLSLTVHQNAVLLFVATSTESSTALGSFVYAIPNLRDTSAVPVSTPLYSDLQTLDLATRLAKSIARKSGKPTFVGNSMSITSAGRGGDVEEEMEAFKKVIALTMDIVHEKSSISTQI